MIVSRLSSIPPVQPTQVSLGYPLTLIVHHPSRSLHLSCLLVLRLLRIRLVLSPSPPRYIENLSSNHLTHKWMEGMFGSGIHCPSLLPLLVPFVLGPHGHAVTCSSRLDLLGYWLSLLYFLVLPYLVNLPLNSLLQICCCSHTLITFEIFISFILSSLFNFCLPFFDLFRPKNWWYTPLSTRFHRLHSLTHHHSRSLNLIIHSPSHLHNRLCFPDMEHNGIQYSTHTFHIPVDLESFTRPYRSQMYHVLANPKPVFLSPQKTFRACPSVRVVALFT